MYWLLVYSLVFSFVESSVSSLAWRFVTVVFRVVIGSSFESECFAFLFEKRGDSGEQLLLMLLIGVADFIYFI